MFVCLFACLGGRLFVRLLACLPAFFFVSWLFVGLRFLSCVGVGHRGWRLDPHLGVNAHEQNHGNKTLFGATAFQYAARVGLTLTLL